jgi:hypothetical protein
VFSPLSIVLRNQLLNTIFNLALEQQKQALSNLSEIWKGASERLFPELRPFSVPISMHGPKHPYALTCETLEEPRHHLLLAKTVGFKEGSIDPRDHLMALILIGERCFHHLNPFLTLLGTLKSYRPLSYTFKERIEEFEEQINMMISIDSAAVAAMLAQSGIADIGTLLTCIRYYRLRVKVTHPIVSKVRIIRDFIGSRHLTTLERLEALDTSKLRRQLDCRLRVPIEHVAADCRRPSRLMSSKETDITLAVIGLYEMTHSDSLKLERNSRAHQKVDNETYQSYVKYALGDSPDFGILNGL